MLGSAIMVVPVIKPEMNKVKAYLPEGEWVKVQGKWGRKLGGKFVRTKTAIRIPAPASMFIEADQAAEEAEEAKEKVDGGVVAPHVCGLEA